MRCPPPYNKYQRLIRAYHLKRHLTESWQIWLETDKPTQGYADSFHCPEFVIPKVFLNQNVFMYSCIFCM